MERHGGGRSKRGAGTRSPGPPPSRRRRGRRRTPRVSQTGDGFARPAGGSACESARERAPGGDRVVRERDGDKWKESGRRIRGPIGETRRFCPIGEPAMGERLQFWPIGEPAIGERSRFCPIGEAAIGERRRFCPIGEPATGREGHFSAIGEAGTGGNGRFRPLVATVTGRECHFWAIGEAGTGGNGRFRSPVAAVTGRECHSWAIGEARLGRKRPRGESGNRSGREKRAVQAPWLAETAWPAGGDGTSFCGAAFCARGRWRRSRPKA